MKPRNPGHRSELLLINPWNLTIDGRNFVLADDGVQDKILIFGTRSNLEKLLNATEIFMDGTFRVTPTIFSQMYTLHAVHRGVMFPLLFALLPDKTQNTYSRMLQLIFQAALPLGRIFNPLTCRIDFESAMIAAIRRVLPGASIKGCFFHYAQAIWRRVQHLGMVQLYNGNPAFRMLVRRFSAMALCPLQLLDELWMAIINEQPPGCQLLVDYMEHTWVGDGSLFPRNIWNHFDGDGIRTNNHLEGWHNGFNHFVGIAHPTIYKLIESLQKEQSKNEGLMLMLNVGGIPPPKTRKYRDLERRYTNNRRQFDNGEKQLMQYIDTASYLVHLQ